jgi:hypothetical protein
VTHKTPGDFITAVLDKLSVFFRASNISDEVFAASNA